MNLQDVRDNISRLNGDIDRLTQEIGLVAGGQSLAGLPEEVIRLHRDLVCQRGVRFAQRRVLHKLEQELEGPSMRKFLCGGLHRAGHVHRATGWQSMDAATWSTYESHRVQVSLSSYGRPRFIGDQPAHVLPLDPFPLQPQLPTHTFPDPHLRRVHPKTKRPPCQRYKIQRVLVHGALQTKLCPGLLISSDVWRRPLSPGGVESI